MLKPAEMSGATRGILLMLLSTLLAASMNTVARHISEGVHPYMIVFFRSLFGLVFLSPFILRSGIGVFRTRRIGAHLGRAGFNVINMMCFFTAVGITPLAELVALGFTAPVFATVLSVLILREVVGMHRWAAIGVGFIGAMVIVRPGFGTISEGHMLTLAAAVTWGGVMLMVKSLSRTESSLTIVAYMAALMTPVSLIPALFVWQWPSTTELAWLALMGAIGSSVHFILAQAVRQTELSTILPFDFTKLVWISLIAYVLFGEVPTWATWTGGTLIFISGVYIAQREALARRRAKP
ncbi:MAG: DMT family transporter [Rhodospirillaceae bacterium]|jgi:drug/metabolite transporter (DMT)-like permease|nr:DMT family transporter [Rhodospirillaceae bacterium]